jgi:hypothetical protein
VSSSKRIADAVGVGIQRAVAQLTHVTMGFVLVSRMSRSARH